MNAIFSRVRDLHCAKCDRVCPVRQSAEAAERCPLGHWGPVYGDAARPVDMEAFRGLQSIMREAGPRLWRELHAAADEYPLADLPGFLAGFIERIPCADCREAFRLLAKNASFESADAFFLWTCDAHNAVNRKLNRREWPIKEATNLWRRLSRPS